MSVFNGEEYLAYALESILSQTYQNFEFIIIDDKSTDGTSVILKRYAEKDKRIVLIKNSENIGLARSLNKGIDLAKGEYIARMDSDDISMPDRFEKQLKYLDNKPEIWVVGGNSKFIDRHGNILRDQIHPQDPHLLRWNILFCYGAIICHPATMIRKSMFDLVGKYKDIKAIEDLELWSRLFFIEPLPIYNMSDTLLYYRWYENNTSNREKSIQITNSNKTRSEFLGRFLQRPIASEVINAYMSVSFEYHFNDIRSYIKIWIESFKKYVSYFKPEKESRQAIYKKLLHRISCYISLNPLNIFSCKRLCLWREYFLLKEIGILGIYRLFKIKLSHLSHYWLECLPFLLAK
jgi:glycosyltransferase involved in cell wall biosynthesis